MTEYLIPEMVTLNEASARTGLSYEFLRKLCIMKQIVHIKSGNRYLVNFGKLCEYLNNGGELSV